MPTAWKSFRKTRVRGIGRSLLGKRGLGDPFSWKLTVTNSLGYTKKILSRATTWTKRAVACFLLSQIAISNLQAGTTTNFGWDYSIEGDADWFDTWQTIFQDIDTDLQSITTTSILNRTTLQDGATFNVASGTVAGPFRINGTAGGSRVLGFSDVGGNIGQISMNSASDSTIEVMTNNALSFFTNSLERARISASGNFGVSTTVPRAVLAIGGGGHFTSSVTAQNFFKSDGTGFLENRNDLQSGSTFYASSGTVRGQFNIEGSSILVRGSSGGPEGMNISSTVITGPACVSGFTRVGPSCCYDTDGAFETLVTSSPVNVHQNYATLDSTTLNGTKAKLALTSTRVFADCDGDANEGTTRFRTRQTGSGASGSLYEALCANGVNDYQESEVTNNTILDTNKDFDYSCGVTVEAEQGNICTVYLTGYCE